MVAFMKGSLLWTQNSYLTWIILYYCETEDWQWS